MIKLSKADVAARRRQRESGARHADDPGLPSAASTSR